MRQGEYQKFDATGLAELVARGEVAPTELLECALGIAAEVNPKLNALARLIPGQARERARGQLAGPFAGVPFLVKELLPYPGLETNWGSRLFRGYVPTEGSPFTQRLDDAGLITFGNTASSEFGLLGSTETLLHGRTLNPLGDAYSAAGSSGGSAAAVAAGIVPMAHASDGGGSIRIPAAVCGLFGFKPSRGHSVAATSDMGPMSQLVTDHCITKTVRDSARFLEATERRDRDALFRPIAERETGERKNLRIGFYTTTLMGAVPDSAASTLVNHTAKLCAELGHELIELNAPPVDGQALSHAFFIVAGSAMAQLATMMEQAFGRAIGPSEIEPFTFELIQWFRGESPDALARATAAMAQAADQMLGFVSHYDVLLCPTLAKSPEKLGYLAPELGRADLIERTENYVGYTPIHNIAGMPAMSVPLFIGSGGMPHGSHFAAAPGNDHRLLSLAFQLEQAVGWNRPLPRA